MSNELAKSQPLQITTIQDMQELGKVFVDSGMFKDVATIAKAVVLILAGREIGIEPFAALSGIHIVQGKTQVGGGIIAGRIKASGKYDYRIKQQDDAGCVIEFFEGGKSVGHSSFTKEDAQKAGTQNMTKYPRNMMFNRAISNGYKWYCPDIFDKSVYVEGELEPITEDTTAHVTTAATPSGNAPVVSEAKPPRVMNALGLKKALTTIEAGDLKTWPSVAGSYSVTEEQLAKLNEAAFTNALPRVKAGEEGVLDAIRLWPLTDEQKAEIEGSGMPF